MTDESKTEEKAVKSEKEKVTPIGKGKKGRTPKPPKLPKDITKLITQWLPVRLTETEMLERGRTMSERHKEREEVEADKKRVTGEYASRITKLGGEIKRLSDTIRTGEESRSVNCEVVKSITDNECRTIRCDTGETIEVRPLREDERQIILLEG